MLGCRRTWLLINSLGLVTLVTGSLLVRAGVASVPTSTATQSFWSFKLLQKNAPPTVGNEKWVRNPIDRFILARLEAERLQPAPEADKRTLIRRATFDLTGLPPTPEEIRAYLADHSPGAYEKLIDRLLASPHYGERWGRHWLDVARYVPGRISFPGIRQTRGDQHYRDYVVRAFNADKPYDQFLTEQLAGDLLPPAVDRQQHFDQITAPAFLSIGAWFDMETDPNRLRLEMVDEMVNTTTQAFLGLTVACARCHDHKTDPIPTEDYYALGGVFRSTKLVSNVSEFWRDGRTRQLRPLAMPDEVAANRQVEQAVAQKKAERWKYLTDRHAELTAKWKADDAQYRAAVEKIAPKPFVRTLEAENFNGHDNLRITQLMKDGRSVEVIETQTPGAQWVKYTLDVPRTARYRLEALYSSDDDTPLAVQVNGTTVVGNALGESTGGWGLDHQRWQTLAECELRQGPNFVRLNVKEGDFPRLDRVRISILEPDTEAKLSAVAASENLNPLILTSYVKDPADPLPTVAGIEPSLDASQRKALADIGAQTARLTSTLKPHEQVVAVTDEPGPTDLPVHVGGDVYRTTAQRVPRGAPRLFDPLLPRPGVSAGSSGRLELARWLSDPRHPLTARVMANRLWHWHFGRGIVATTSDFGKTGEAPTHPELLDWLAATFVENRWSMKSMHRLIMTSATYRQSAARQSAICDPQSAIEADPDNKLLSRFPRRRLEAEAVYDAMRSTNNVIPRQPPGQPLDQGKSKDRAMYVLANGRSPAGLGSEVRKLFPLFDADLSGRPLAVRPSSATPAQSLFFMNNPLVKYMADRFAERLLKMDKLDDAKRLEMAYLLALGRPPGEQMEKQALAFLEQCQKEEKLSKQEAWSKLCQALFGTAEFRYLE